MTQSCRSSVEPHISCTDELFGPSWMLIVPCGNVMLVGVEVKTDGREDSRMI